ncbi:MAG: thermonuclease family protein [Burkholderiaceae bacterium]|nr:thermonuclease family protein [Burkholderiaceae bacterium]
MQTVHESTTAHVRRAVCHHEFVDAGDWASGLDELAGFTDDEIEALAQDEPSDLIIFAENVPLLGITQAQQQADRELFQRCSGLLRTAMVAAALLLSAGSSARALELSGPATVIDGDTLVVAGHHVRIWGIDAPELRQTCGRPGGAQWPCGESARDALVRLVGGERVVCQSNTHDKYGRDIARCRVGTLDVGANLVRDGWALDWSRYSVGEYEPQQDDARASLDGIWCGPFENPWNWRHAQSEEAVR